MPKAIFQKFVQTSTGEVDPSASFTVVDEDSGLPVTIYSDRAGATPITGPTYFVYSTGLIEFYFDEGSTIRVTVTGGTGSFTVRYAEGRVFGDDDGDSPRVSDLGTAAKLDSGTAPTEIPTNEIADSLRVKKVDSLVDLPAATGSGNTVQVNGYYAGSTKGGGVFVDIGLARHNGGTIIDPSRSGEIGTSAYYVDSGVDANCFERPNTDYVTPDMFGVSDDSTDYSLAFQRMSSINTKIKWGVLAKINRADFGEYLDLEFVGDGAMYTDEATVKDGSGVITYAGASLISTTAINVKISSAVHSGTLPANSSYLCYVNSPSLEYASVEKSRYLDSGHWFKGGESASIYEIDNKFRSSDYAGISSRVSAIAFSQISVGTENWAAEDEPRTRHGRLQSKGNDFDVWCPTGANIDLAKYTGLCQAPQIVNNLYHNRNINAEAEVDTFTASYRGRHDNDYRNCSLKVQTVLGALSSQTTSSPVAHFSRISGSFKFDDGSVNLFGILARGGYFLLNNYVIDAKKTTANVNFNAIHVRSSDDTYYEDDSGTGAAINYRVGSGLIDIRCDDYNGQTVSPFNEFTSRLHYDYDGVTVLGGNSLVANGLNPGSLRNVSIYHADSYPVFAVQGVNLYSQSNLLLNSDGSNPNAILSDERGKNNFADTVATSINPSTLTANTLNIDETSSDIDLAGIGTIDTIIGGFRGSRVTLRFISGSTTLVHNISKISLSGASNKTLNAAGQVIELKRLSSGGIWYELGGTI